MAPTATDRFAAARGVADAVLYEGYVLYPYRASARKNQIRWQFGVLVPRRQAELDGSERSSMRHRVHRRSRRRADAPRAAALPAGAAPHDRGGAPASGFEPVDVLDVDGVPWVAWDEAVEHEVDRRRPARCCPSRRAHIERCRSTCPAGATSRSCAPRPASVVGRAVRTRGPVAGRVRIETSWADGPGAFLAVAVTVENVTDWCAPGAPRDEVDAPVARRRAHAARRRRRRVRVACSIHRRRPPRRSPGATTTARSRCSSARRDDVVLSSPIILYDQPEIAPESVGDLFDATEIDEILALRVLTLTDDEKAEARGTDPRAAAIVDRCDDMPPEVWARLHGADPLDRARAEQAAAGASRRGGTRLPRPSSIRGPRPWSIGGVDVARGLEGRAATRPPAGRRPRPVPGRDGRHRRRRVPRRRRRAAPRRHGRRRPGHEALAWQGRYLFFRPDEVEPVEADG